MFTTFYAASPGVFVLCTIILGGAAAYVTGKAIAETWRPFWQVVAYVLSLGLVVRFIQYALFQERLVSGQNYVIDVAILLGFGIAGYMVARRRQMATQYGQMTTRNA